MKFTLDRKSLESVYFSFVSPVKEYTNVLFHNWGQMENPVFDFYLLLAAVIFPLQRSKAEAIYSRCVAFSCVLYITLFCPYISHP